MIFLLTGEPFAGKSTVTQKFVEGASLPCDWVITREVVDGSSERVGYEAVNSGGQHHLLAHQTAIKSDVIVGSRRYYVDPRAIDEMFTDPLRVATKHPARCFVLDEIGNMQRLSPHFTAAVDIAFDQDICMIATIRTSHEWTVPYINHQNAYPLAVTPETRDQLPAVLEHVMNHLSLLSKLTPGQARLLRTLTRQYGAHPMQLDKLYQNALPYVVEEHVTPQRDGTFLVQGSHGQYTVAVEPTVTCTCPLFTGAGVYIGQAGDCSHLMAVQLYLASRA